MMNNLHKKQNTHRLPTAPAGLALALLMCLQTAPAHAQEGALTLSTALRQAEQGALSAQTAQARVGSAEALARAARAPLTPNVTLSASPGIQAPLGSAPGLALTGNVTGSQLLYDGGGLKAASRVAETGAQVASVSAEQAAEDAMLTAGVAYFQVTRAAALVDVDRAGVQQAQEHLQLGNKRLRAGTATRAEILQLQARLANAQDTLLQNQNALAVARLNLDVALNMELGDRPLDASASVALTPAEAKGSDAEALARRQDVRSQALRIEQDAQRASLERAGRRPSISAVGRVGPQTVGPASAFAGVSLSWNAVDGGRADARRQAAAADEAADRLQADQIAQAARLDIRQQRLTRDQASTRLKSARQALAAADEALRIAHHRYALGLSTSIELTDIEATRTQAAVNLAQADADNQIATLRLRRALALPMASAAP